jgi:peptidoglycan/LPS O-acetylase OafA/YrhL
MVCFGHFGQALNPPNNPNNFFNIIHSYGSCGVYIFFVISGFVIPLSFYNGNYDITNYFKFLYKRLLRLHPPFLLAVALTIIIMLVSYKMRHLIFPETISSIIATCFYMHILPDNPVFWTLAIEAQYYIFIGMFYLLIIRFPKITAAVIVLVLMVFAKVPFVYNFITLFSYLDFFLIGTIGFLAYKKIGNAIINYLIIAGLIVFAVIN